MINKIIQDIDKALRAEAYLSALALALTLPDICAKVAYKDNNGNKERYIKWFDEYVVSECDKNDKMPYISGEVAYNLRCNFLHQGTPNIDSEKIENEQCKITNFKLCVQKTKDIPIYGEASSISSNSSDKEYCLNIQLFCLMLQTSCLKYYNNNKESFDFFNYTIINLDEIYKSV